MKNKNKSLQHKAFKKPVRINRFGRVSFVVFGVFASTLWYGCYQYLTGEITNILGSYTLFWFMIDNIGDVATIQTFFFSLFIIYRVRTPFNQMTNFFGALGWSVIAISIGSLMEVFLGGEPLLGVAMYELLFSTIAQNISDAAAFAFTGVLALIFMLLFFMSAFRMSWLPVDTILATFGYFQHIKNRTFFPFFLYLERLNIELANRANKGILDDTKNEYMSHFAHKEYVNPNEYDYSNIAPTYDTTWESNSENDDLSDDSDDMAYKSTEDSFFTSKPTPYSDITDKFADFGITCEVAEVCDGHRVKRYYLEVPPSQNLSKFTQRQNDLALAFNSAKISFGNEPTNGQFFIDVDKPKNEWRNVEFADVLGSNEFRKLTLGIALGFDVTGNPIVFEAFEMRHTLGAGKNGSGKSNITHLIICSLLIKHHMINLYLVDTRQVVAAHYENCKSITTTTQAKQGITICSKAVKKMRERDKLFGSHKCSDILSFNKKFPQKKQKFIFVIIEELTDLIGIFPNKEAKAKFLSLIKQLTIGGRKSGIYLIASTQYAMKSQIGSETAENFTTKICGLVDTHTAAATIMGDSKQYPAHSCQGQGDFYLKHDGMPPTRFTAAFLSDNNIQKITANFRKI